MSAALNERGHAWAGVLSKSAREAVSAGRDALSWCCATSAGIFSTWAMNVVAASSSLWSALWPPAARKALSRVPALGESASRACRAAGAVGGPLGVSDGLVGEVGDAALEGLGAGEAQGFG